MEELASDFENVNIETDEKDVKSTEVETENEKNNSTMVEEKVEVPEVGKVFDSIAEVFTFYQRYAKEKGFGMSIRSSRKVGGEVRYMTIACNHYGKARNRSSKSHHLQPQSKTDCKAKISVVHCADGKWMLNSVVLAHNHVISPSKARFYRCHRVLSAAVQRKLELNDRAGIRMNKSFNSLVVEARGYPNMQCLEKDCRNFMNKARRLQLGEGDANAMSTYFLKMQADNPNFFYTMELDQKSRLKNVFWADARSRAAFKEFGDVVTFDTTYLINKYAMPFAPFVGVNHHGQSTLLGCGLISSEDTETFTWLFQVWLTCMDGCPPNAIITDQDRAMKKAIKNVFPNARHRWCLWHLLKKLPEKLRGYNEYKSINFCMKKAVYDLLTTGEFEENWGEFIKKYKLESNEWLLGLYEERHHWVPAFVKDMFWAGMSTTQRSESINSFFDGYVHSKTTLKQFVEQYEGALAKRVEDESKEEFNSLNSWLPCITGYEMEKQFQSAYTIAKFKEFQDELMGKICCDLSSSNECDDTSEYKVEEDMSFEDLHWRRTFTVYFNEDTYEANCNCRLFECRGIVCRYQIVVYIHRNINQIPCKYILKRWSKIVKRSQTKIRISYDNWAVKPEVLRFDKMCNAFHEGAELATNSEYLCENVMERVRDIHIWLKEEHRKSEVLISSTTQAGSNLRGDDIATPKEGTNIEDPLIVHHKGRPPSKRKQSTIEKVIKKRAVAKRKINRMTTKGNAKKASKDVGNAHNSTPAMECVGTQESSQHGAVQQHFGQPNMVHGGSFAFQPIMNGQGIGMHPFYGHHPPQPFWSTNNDLASNRSTNAPANFFDILGAVNGMTQAQDPGLHKDGGFQRGS